ncbi:sulfate/molybdate ABC transporter ATP-binding protein [Thermocrispum agreste]|uniref:sulfate/molybdate ABC transporter ATP-binding protein n=1 Tax=Thermocrispum agreste TaxID=37925 RepID=UPI0004213A39|nr:ABC transporter ATP-binding protein [Thermocrispum agreste]
MTLRAVVRAARGQFRLSVELSAERGHVVAVLGHNGAGKSTLLDCLAGLLRSDETSVRLDGRELGSLPPHRRRVGLLRQRPLLFPHLTVRDNVAFGPRAAGASRRQARAIAGRWLAAVGAEEYADRRPDQLSGGQAQRVALARALATEPELLLLDEPLAALDADAAPAMRALLRTVLRSASKRVTVLVTHDPLDALALADTALVLADGRVVERGPTQRVLSAPRTPYAARLAGLNLVAGEAVEGGLRTPDGDLLSGLHAEGLEPHTPAVAVFAPSAVSVYPRGKSVPGSPRNTAEAVVAAVEPHGPVIRVRTRASGGWAGGLTADLTPAAVADLALDPGKPVTVVVKATAVDVHPASSLSAARSA